MPKHKKRVNSISIDGNAEDSKVFIGNSNTFHETNHTVHNNNYFEKEGDDFYRDTISDAKDEFSREIRETVLISILTGFILTLGWAYARKFADLIPYPSAILTAILLSIFRINKLGLWHSFVAGSTIGVVFTVTAIIERQYTAMDFIVSEALILAFLFNCLLGILFGAIIGFVISLTRPLGV